MRSSIPMDWGVQPCLDLINSRFNDHLGSGVVYDRLRDPVFRRAFLERWHYTVGRPDDARSVSRLARLRGVVREALESYIAGRDLPSFLREDLEQEMNRAPMRLALVQGDGASELVLERLGPEWDLVTADIATSAGRLIAERRKVKVCANPN